MNRKYVILKDFHPQGYESEEFAVLIDPRVAHVTVHDMVRKNDIRHRPVRVETYTKPIAAGFFNVSKDSEVSAFGESESLGIGSRPEDAAVIHRLIFG